MLIHPVLIEQIKKGQEYTSIYTTIYNNRAGVIRRWLTLTFGFKNQWALQLIQNIIEGIIYFQIIEIHYKIGLKASQFEKQLISLNPRYHQIFCYLQNNTKSRLNKMQTNGAQQPQKRSKEPSDKQIKYLKNNFQTLNLPNNRQLYYSIAIKDSKSGFFTNDRLIICNTQDRSLGYVSKLPQGLLPFLSQQEVKSVKFKSKISREQILNGTIQDFRCRFMPRKIFTFEISFRRGDKGQNQQWVMQMGNGKLSNQWVELINQTLLKDDIPPQQPEKQPQPIKPDLSRQRVQSNKNIKQIDSTQNPPPPPLQPNNSKINFTNISYEQPQLNSSRIANMPFSDHVTELKYLRKEKPGMFNITNELSRKKLPAYQEEFPQNNQNNQNAMQGNKLNFSKKPSIIRESGINSKVEQPKNEGELLRPLQNSQLIAQPIKKPSSKLLNPSPQQQYDSHLNEQARQPQVYLPVSRSRQIPTSKFTKSNPMQRQPLEDSRPSPASSKVSQAKYPYDSDQGRNLVIQNRNKGGAVTRIDSKRNNFNSNEQNKKARISPKSSSLVRQKTYNNSRTNINRRKWNEIFAETNDKLQIHQEFIQSCFNTVRDIVNQLALDQNRKEYLPIQVKPPFFTYYSEGIIIVLHHFDKNTRSTSLSQNAPLLYDQNTYELLKREFYNYNAILGVTANQGFIKVPLCGYFEYKGVIALCKAEIPQSFSEVTPKRYEKQFDIIQNQIHIRFLYGSFNSYLHPSSKYLILDNIKQFIPQIPLNKNETFFFRKEFLNSYAHIIQDLQDTNQANDFIIQNIAPELLSRLQSLQTYVVNSTDLARIMHQQGLSTGYLPFMVQQTRSAYLKRVFMSELVSIVLSAVFRSQIHNLYQSFPIDDYQEASLDIINTVLIDSCHALLQMMFSYSNNSQNLWRIIVQQCKAKYKITVSKQDLIPGYILGSICERIGIVCDYRRSSFDKHKVEFFAKQQNIPRDLLAGFKMKIRRYDLSSISSAVQTVQSILFSDPTPQNFKSLISLLNLKQQPIPNYLQPYQQQILTYLCNFVPYSEHQQFQHVGIYNMVLLQPHSYYSTKCSLLAIKWCIKKRFVDQAIKIYQMKQLQNAFWLGEYNPAISQFYDFFSMYYASMGRYDEAIQLAKLSLKNIMKVVGAAQLPVADKHYQLGNIFFKMGRKEDSLKEYSQTKEILQSHQQTSIAEYGVILLKLSLLYLNFGKISEAINHSLQALKIFDVTQTSQQDKIGTYQILSRCYQITKKQKELQNVCSMVGQKFNQTQDHLIFQRMAKLSLYIMLKNLSAAQSKAFLAVISKLEAQAQGYNEMQAFSFLHRKSNTQVLMVKVEHYLQNIVYLYQQASKKDLFRRYKSLELNTRSEAEQMLVILQALGVFIGFGYLIGSLRENYE